MNIEVVVSIFAGILSAILSAHQIGLMTMTDDGNERRSHILKAAAFGIMGIFGFAMACLAYTH